MTKQTVVLTMILSIAGLSACGGDAPATPPSPATTTSPSPTEDPLEEAIAEVCADMTRSGSTVADFARAGEALASSLDRLAAWLRDDADAIEDLGGDEDLVRAVREIGTSAAAEAERLRTTYPGETSIEEATQAFAEYGQWHDRQVARLPEGACPDLAGGG